MDELEKTILKCADILDKCFTKALNSYGGNRDPHEFRDAYYKGYNDETKKSKKYTIGIHR